MTSAASDLEQSRPDPRAGLRIGVLGPLLVVRGEAEAQPRPAGQRAVLALLALALGSPVRLESIIAALWRQEPPDTAAGIVQTYISRLRSLLAPAPGSGRGRLLSRDALGYRLHVPYDEMDLVRFRRLARRARSAHALGDSRVASMAYEQALGLWRGEPLADLDVLRGHPAVTALADERTKIALEYADIACRAGWYDRVLPHLRVLSALDPLDELLHAWQMIALAGSGRQAEALHVYDGLRRRLNEELGVQPSPELRSAQARVLRQEIAAPSGLAGRLAAPTVWLPVYQLPTAPADFTGRAAECALLTSVISPADECVPVAAISGPPGIGKTALALHVAHQVRARFPDGQLWVQLAGASAHPRDPAEVLGEFLRALGMPDSAVPETIAERAACYRSRLAGRKVLVVADDAASAAQTRPLLPGTAGCALLVASRARLEGLAGAQLVGLEVMTPADSIAMLTRIVGQHRIDAEHEVASKLVEACGALPLALRIAAAKLNARPSWPLAVMLRKITRDHNRLRELETTDLSVRASIAPSYESLSERSRRGFRLLALMGRLDFAEWVVGVLLGESRAAGVINDLIGKSLLAPTGVDGTGEPRYRLYDLLSDYAIECLGEEEPAGTIEAAAGRLLDSWLQLAAMANKQLPPGLYYPPLDRPQPRSILAVELAERLTSDPVAWFTAERLNLLAAAIRACPSCEPGLVPTPADCHEAFRHGQSQRDVAECVWQALAAVADQVRRWPSRSG